MTRAQQILAYFLLASTAPVSVAAAQEANEAKANPTGTWKWERTFGENTMHFTLRLKNEDDKLTGQLATKRGDEEMEPAKIEDAKLEGDKVSFTVTRQFNDREFTIAYVGKVTDSAIRGTTKFGAGDSVRESDWQAKRGLDWTDVVGTWILKFETPNGNVVESTLKIIKEGEAAKGTITSERFGERELKDIAIKDARLTFATIAERDGNEFRVNYTIEPRGDTLQGRIQFGADESRGFEFTGHRADEEKID